MRLPKPMSRPPAPLEPLELHAPDVLAAASGETLVLWPSEAPHRVLSGAVTRVEHAPNDDALTVAMLGDTPGCYDTVVSIGQLGTTADLHGLVAAIRELLEPSSVLLFCEPTIADDRARPGPPNDVTGALWRGGLTVFECRRYRARHRLRTHEYCWGRARLTPA